MDPSGHAQGPTAGGGGVSLEEEKAALTGRLEELRKQEIRASQEVVREKQKTLEDTETIFQTKSKKLELELAEVERRRKQVKAQLVSFRKEKTKEIKDLTVEVGNLRRQIVGKESVDEDPELDSSKALVDPGRPLETSEVKGRARGRPRGRPELSSSIRLPDLLVLEDVPDLVVSSDSESDPDDSLPSLL